MENSSTISLDDLFEKLRDVSNLDDVPPLLRNLNVVIEGSHLAGSIDYQIAQAIVQVQQIVYRVAAHSLYGEAATVKNLSDVDLENFKLSFLVVPGCTKVSANVAAKFLDLLKVIFKDMNPTQRIIIASLLSAVFLGYIGLGVLENYLENEEQKELLLNLSKEESRRLEIIFPHVSVSGEEAANTFAKSAKGASNLIVGGRRYSDDALAEIQKRTPRTLTEWVTKSEPFVVLSLDCTKPDVVWAVLQDTVANEQFKASYAVDEDVGDTEALLDVLAKSLTSGAAVKLTVSKGRKTPDGRVIKATIQGVAREQ